MLCGSSSSEEEEEGAGSRGQPGHPKCLYQLQTVLGWEGCQDAEMQPASSLSACFWLERREQKLCSSQSQTPTHGHIYSKLSHDDHDAA